MREMHTIHAGSIGKLASAGPETMSLGGRLEAVADQLRASEQIAGDIGNRLFGPEPQGVAENLGMPPPQPVDSQIRDLERIAVGLRATLDRIQERL